MMFQRIYSDTRTPETPEQLPEKDHLCKMIKLPSPISHPDAETPFAIGDLLLEIKHESESILRLMEQHQNQ